MNSKKGFLIFFHIFFSYFFFTFGAKGQAKEFFKTAKNSTIIFYKIDSAGNLVSHGTGFTFYNYDTAFHETIIATCEHLTHHENLVVAIPVTDTFKHILSPNINQYIEAEVYGVKSHVFFDGENFLYKIHLKKNINLFTHPNLDLAIILCQLPQFAFNDKEKRHYNSIVLNSYPKSWIGKRDDFYAGEEIVFVGFPQGIGSFNGRYGNYSDKRTNPLIRKGIISWLPTNSELSLIDGFSLGGNSGSPIFSVPNYENLGYFMGMIIGHLYDPLFINNVYIDTLKKQFTQYQVQIDPNIGLAIFIPSYIIYEFAEIAREKRKMILAKELKK